MQFSISSVQLPSEGPQRPGASKIDTRAVGFIAALIVLAGICGILYVGEASRVYVLRSELQDRVDEREVYYRENALLRTEIARQGSSNNLERWARALGYVERREPHYVSIEYSPYTRSQGTDELSADSYESRAESADSDDSWVGRISIWGENAIAQFQTWLDLAAAKSGIED